MTEVEGFYHNIYCVTVSVKFLRQKSIVIEFARGRFLLHGNASIRCLVMVHESYINRFCFPCRNSYITAQDIVIMYFTYYYYNNSRIAYPDMRSDSICRVWFSIAKLRSIRIVHIEDDVLRKADRKIEFREWSKREIWVNERFWFL